MGAHILAPSAAEVLPGPRIRGGFLFERPSLTDPLLCVPNVELPLPLVIKATKSNGAAIVAVTVNFRVTSGGGSMFAGSATTDSKGIVADYWTLGTSSTLDSRWSLAAG